MDIIQYLYYYDMMVFDVIRFILYALDVIVIILFILRFIDDVVWICYQYDYDEFLHEMHLFYDIFMMFIYSFFVYIIYYLWYG